MRVWGTVQNTLKCGETEKRGEKTKPLKRGGKLGQGVGASKITEGVGTPLQTMSEYVMIHLKSSFSSRKIQFFVFWSSPLFYPVSHCLRV